MANPIIIDLSSDDPPSSHAADIIPPVHGGENGRPDFPGTTSVVELQDERFADKPSKRRRLSRSPSIDVGRAVGTKERTKPGLPEPFDDSISSASYGGMGPAWRPIPMGLDDLSDPIILSSSPMPGAKDRQNRRGASPGFLRSVDEVLDESKEHDYGGQKTTHVPHSLKSQLSERTAILLADLAGGLDAESPHEFDGVKTLRSKPSTRRPKQPNTRANGPLPTRPLLVGREHGDPVHKPASAVPPDDYLISKKSKPPDEMQKQRAQDKVTEKDREKARKAAEKEAERERKHKAKEEKAREKQIAAELAQVNRAKTDKKISTQEMIVDLPDSLQQGVAGDQIRNFLQGLQVIFGYDHSPLGQVIKWRRNVTARYNEELGHWEPTAAHIENERHVLCLLYAKDFVNLACADPATSDGQDFDSHVLKLKTSSQDCKIIYLIEGLTAWMRKNKNVRNRAYQAAVRNQLGGNETGTARAAASSAQPESSRRKKPSQEYIDEDMIEDCLLRLQIVHECLVHHTAAPVETAEWISNFTQHISTIPYRAERMNLDTSFCMDVGQVKTGDDKDDTYVKMLQEIVRVTPSIAYGIAGQYPNVGQLLRGLKERGPLALQDLKVSTLVFCTQRLLASLAYPCTFADLKQKTANKDGALTNSNIGPAISRRVYKIFTGTDPSTNEV